MSPLQSPVLNVSTNVKKSRNTPGSWQNSFSLTSRELYRIIFCLNVLLIFVCVYLLTKVTLRDICHELRKQPSEGLCNNYLEGGSKISKVGLKIKLHPPELKLK